MTSLIMDKARVMDLLERTGAYRLGHFEHPAGHHTPHYFQMPLALRYADNSRVLSVSLSRMMRRSREIISSLPNIAIVAPGPGGVPVAFEIRNVLGAEQIVWAEREDGDIRFRQFSDIKEGQRCLIVDDIARSGRTVQRVHEMITDSGGIVLGVGVLVRFTRADLDLGKVPVHALLDYEAIQYMPDECPLCKDGVPIEQVRF